MGLEKGIEQLAQVFEKEGGIYGAKSKPVNDRTECPISNSKSSKILLVVGRLCFTNRKWNYLVVNIYFLYD